MSVRERQCLELLAEGYNTEQGVYFYSHITNATGLTLTQARRAVRALARKGLAKLTSCFDMDDGLIAGRGYEATAIGFEVVQKAPILPDRAAVSRPHQADVEKKGTDQ